MRTTLTINLRLVFAVLFGVMSAVPMPARALTHPTSIQHMHAASAADATPHHARHAAGHHGDRATGHQHDDYLATVPSAGDEPTPQPGDGTMSCHSAPCCLAVTQSLPSLPATVLLLLGRLVVPPAKIIVAVTPDPVVPPPRLQA